MLHRDTRQPPDFNQLIQIAERRDFDLIPAIETDSKDIIPNTPTTPAENLSLVRINAIAKSLPYKKIEVERYLMEDVIAGLYSSKIPFIYLILGTAQLINVYLGVLERRTSQAGDFLGQDSAVAILISSLQSTYPNIEIERLNEDAKNNISQILLNCRHYGIMTGIPTQKLGIEEYGVEQIERLIRGLYQYNFGYMVIATPIEEREVVMAFDDISNQIREFSVFVKMTQQYVQTERLTLSGESTNRQAQYYIEILETILDKLKLAKAQGLWNTQVYFFSPQPATYARMGNLLRVVFSGDKSFPEPIRTLPLVGKSSSTLISNFQLIEFLLDYHPLSVNVRHPLQRLMKNKYTTILNSRDLATLTHLPKEEMPGYNVKETARFGVHPRQEESGASIRIGVIMDRGLSTGNDCVIKVKDLVKHGIVVGVTGSGKTNTIFYLLSQLHNEIPFLVIEPAKCEYRALSQIEEFQDLQIFTLGDETVAPFRLNPFEVMEGVQVQSHIDHLRAVFNASFIMYAPMPYVLERCIHEVYQDKGWDLVTSKNRFQSKEQQGRQMYLFPTLTDLYEKIETVVDRLGYEEKITMDVKAALKTRIGSLRIGGKGAMLDTPYSIPMELLLSKPTILELHNIGDDEEKAFIIGLLLARLYEFLEAERTKGQLSQGLRHITVIEEAHRLLTRTAPETGNLEVVNIKAKAVETFCNLLSEIRSYGEGILIAEQIPSKLAPDAIKNSNLKIVHRMVAKDDREMMGSTMNLSDEQNRYLTLLEPGFAAVFYEGIDNPFLVKVPYFPETIKTARRGTPGNGEIAQFMKKKLSSFDSIYGRHIGCEVCLSKCRYFDIVNQIFEDPEAIQMFASYLLAIVENGDSLASKYRFWRDYIFTKAFKFNILPEEVENLILCSLIIGGNKFFNLKQKQYNLTILQQNSLIDGYVEIINKWFPSKMDTQLTREVMVSIEQFQKLYKEAFKVASGPFPGCDEFCQNRCLFRFEVQPYVFDKNIESALISAINSSKNAVRKLCFDIANKVSLGEKPAISGGYCTLFLYSEVIKYGG